MQRHSEIDRLLVARIRAGETDAWKDVIARYEGRLLAFAESRVGNRAAAEDVVQEAFLGFLTSLPNYDMATPLESWLFSIAAHKLTDYLRREGRRPTIPMFAGDDSNEENELPGPGRRASSLMQSQERKQTEEAVIAACLDDLVQGWIAKGEFERLKCAELLFVKGLANKTAAAQLGISEQAVANHKHFVVSKLKAAGGV